jgi:acyl carrier protein
MVTSMPPRGDLTREAVAAAVRGSIARALNRPVDEIGPQAKLEDDLGLDSLAMIHASIVIEESLQTAVATLDAPEGAVVTVADLIDFIHGRIRAEVTA